MPSSQSHTQSSNANHHFSWKFDNIDSWRHESQDDSPSPQYSIQGGKLTIFTRANSKDRQKMSTYQWRTHIPSIITSDQASIGCFLYCDDCHELYFEIGYGKPSEREEMHISQDDQLKAYMTCQDFPYTSECVAIKPGWHDLVIRLDLANGKYLASWLIDGE